MSDFVRDLEAELLAAARRRTARARRFRPPALIAAVAVAATLLVVALMPRAGEPSSTAAPQQARTCSVFPDATVLLRDAPCTSNPFGQ